MKIKRTLLSFIVFLSVFCLSALFDIQDPFFAAKGGPLKTEPSLLAETNTLMEVTEAPLTQSLAYVGNNIMSYSVDQNLLSTETVENQSEINNDQTEDNPASNEATNKINKSSIASQNLSEVNSPAQPTQIPEEPTPTEAPAPEAAPSQYSNIGISMAESYVNIRETESTDSDVLGKLYRDSAAEILSSDGDWLYVESGSVKGYVKAEYIKTGIPDDELIASYGILSILVKVDGLNVRSDPDTTADKLTVVYINEKYPVIDLQDEWVKVDVTDDKEIGYVKREYAELIVDFKKAVSKEEEKELLRLQAEERAKKETEVQYWDGLDYTAEDLKLLSCLVYAEAGNQSYEGKLAVANIVLNRVKSWKYPDTIEDVIYQPGQFTVAASGSLDKQLENYDSYSTQSQLLTIKAARAALEGANNMGNRLYFHSYKVAVRKGYENKPDCVKLDDQLFW